MTWWRFRFHSIQNKNKTQHQMLRQLFLKNKYLWISWSNKNWIFLQITKLQITANRMQCLSTLNENIVNGEISKYCECVNALYICCVCIIPFLEVFGLSVHWTLNMHFCRRKLCCVAASFVALIVFVEFC